LGGIWEDLPNDSLAQSRMIQAAAPATADKVKSNSTALDRPGVGLEGLG